MGEYVIDKDTMRSIVASAGFPWLVAGLCLLLTLALVGAGWWRAAGVGPQVQVPMFYDAHYLFPRPWTQAQEAPGVPAPAPVAALYGPNRLSQPFVAGSDGLSLVTVWLAGEPGMAVTVSLAGQGVAYQAEFRLDKVSGRYYYFSFPPLSETRDQRFIMTLQAAAATAAQPVTARAVGGDRLGSSIMLNEYSRPGNLALYSYASGRPGRWWLEALSEQLLPAVFRLRLQQYKPPLFKGTAFPALLGTTMILSLAFLMMARPAANSLRRSAGWWASGLLLALLVWQLGSGRLLLRSRVPLVTLEPAANALAVAALPAADPLSAGELRLVHDLALTLWTAERLPEPRFIAAGWFEGRAAIGVPAASLLRYALVVPPDGRFHTGVAIAGKGGARFTVRWNGQEIGTGTVPAAGETLWLDLELSPWGGQAGFLELATEPVSGLPAAWWLTPQLASRSPWLLAAVPSEPATRPAAVYFGDGVQLAGYAVTEAALRPGQPFDVTLYWHTAAPGDAQATVFVHLLAETGEIVTQQDGPPVAGAYPVSAWQPESIVADTRRLQVPVEVVPGAYRLAVGLYDPVSLARWPAYDVAGSRLPDDRALLELPLEISAE